MEIGNGIGTSDRRLSQQDEHLLKVLVFVRISGSNSKIGQADGSYAGIDYRRRKEHGMNKVAAFMVAKTLEKTTEKSESSMPRDKIVGDMLDRDCKKAIKDGRSA